MGLTAVVIAVVVAGVYFRKTLMRWAPWLCLLCTAVVVVAAIAGVDVAGEIVRGLAGPAPKDFREYIAAGVFVAVWNLVDYLRRRRRDDQDQADGEP